MCPRVGLDREDWSTAVSSVGSAWDRGTAGTPFPTGLVDGVRGAGSALTADAGEVERERAAGERVARHMRANAPDEPARP